MQNPAYNLRRVASYLLGFVLFYEPFMLFNQLASTFFVDTSFSSIHVPCARIPLASIVTGDWQYASPISLFFCLLCDLLRFSFTDALDLCQTLRLFLNNTERILFELPHDPCCQLAPSANF